MTQSRSNKDNTSEYYKEVSESIKCIFDLTSRIDERVKNAVSRQELIDKKVDEKLERFNNIEARLQVVENVKKDLDTLRDTELSSLRDAIHTLDLKIQECAIATKGQENKWRTALNFAVQIAWVILASYLLLKLGIQAPQIP